MNCSIQRNQEGKVVKVVDNNGQPSQLFQAIHSNIFLGDADTSLQVMANAYSSRVEKADVAKYDNGEPKLFYKAPGGREFESLESLIISGLDGQVSAGFKAANGEFIPTFKFDTASSERSAFLTGAVREGVLSAERELGEDGTTRFKGKGEFKETRKVTAQMSRLNALVDLGVPSRISSEGLIEIEFPTDIVALEKEAGEDFMLIKDAAEAVQNDPKVKNRVDIITKYLTRVIGSRDQKVDSESDKKATAILNNLNGFLKTLGFSTTTLEEYRKRYNTKYGKDPDIQAIADMANRVVAFSNGTIGIEDLSEEVAHIAIEFYEDTNSIAGALAVVHLTPEYNQYAEYYREKYAPFYEGTELEDQVRKEILGKVLATEFQTRFSREGVSAERNSIITKLLEILDYLRAAITNRMKPAHIRTLERLNNQIADAVLEADMSQFDVNTQSTNFYYSAMSQPAQAMEGNLRLMAKATEDFYKRVVKQPVPNQQELDRIVENMQDTAVLSSINTIAGMMETQFNVLQKNLEEVARTQGDISSVDANRYIMLSGKIMPIMNELKVGLQDARETSDNKDIIDSLIRTIDNLNKKKDDIEPRMRQDFARTVERLLDEYVTESNLTEKEAEALRSQLEGNMRDATVISSRFGLMSHMQNPVIQMIARVISDMGQRVVREFKKTSDTFISEVYDKGYQKYQRNVFKLKDGKKTHYLKSFIDFAKQDADREAKQVEVISQLTGKKPEDVKRLLQTVRPTQILQEDAKILEYNKQMNSFETEESNEKRFNADYYKTRDDRFDKAGVSQATRDYLSSANSTVYNVLSRAGAVNRNGTIDNSKLTEADKILISDAKRSKAIVRSAYDQFGNLKEGLRKVKLSELTDAELEQLPFYSEDFTFGADLIVLEKGYSKDELEESARIALDLFNLSMLYRTELKDNTKTGAPSKDFISKIEAMESLSPEKGFDWATANATITLNDAYFSNIGAYQSYDVVAQEFINSLPDTNNRDRKQDVLDEYKSLQRVKKDLLRQNRKVNNPLETDVINMPLPIQDRLREIDSRIAELRKELDVPQEFMSEAGVPTTRKSVTEDFAPAAKQAQMSEYDFALKHMTDSNRAKVVTFSSRVRDILSGKATYVKPSYERFISDMKKARVIDDSMPIATKVEILKTEFAKQNVASYFQRYAPEGYDQVMEAFRSGELKMSDVLKNKAQLIEKYPALEYLEVVPDYTWVDDNTGEDIVNQKFISTWDHYKKPRLDKYVDDEFFSYYGIDKQAWLKNPTMNLEEVTPTKNVEEYRYLSMIVALRKKSIELQGEKGNINEFLAVQMTASRFENFARVSNLGNISMSKDAIKDFFQNRKDEKQYGELLDNQEMDQVGSTVNVKLIPKYFLNRVEDPESLTENTLMAALVDYKQALLYKERNNSERTLKALEFKVANQKFISNGGFQRKNRILKEGAVSNYYYKAQEYLDYHLYGITQSRHFETEIFGQRVDLTRIGMKLQAWARFSNLAFNPFVDLTSAITGILSNIVDRFAGDYYHKSSANRGNSLVTKMSGNYLKEMGSINKTNSLNQILEFLNVTDPEERLRESSFGRVARLINRSPYLGSKAANQPVGPKIALTILCDYRLDPKDGAFRSYAEFTKNRKIDGVSQVAIESEWKKLEKESLYDYMDITPTSVTYKQAFADKFENPDELFGKLTEKVAAKVRQVVQNADGTMNNIDQVAAQRDILTSPFLMHRGWLLINSTKKFKKQHFNLSTGTTEEGHYRTFMQAIQELRWKALNPINVYAWTKEQELYRQANMRRNITEVIILSSILAIGELIFAADDDDDTELENLAQLIHLRTVSEFATSTAFGIPGSVIEAVGSPLPAAQTYKVLNPMEWYNKLTNEEEGDLIPFLLKGSVLKRGMQLADLQTQVDAFRHFNDNTLFNLGEEQKQ